MLFPPNRDERAEKRRDNPQIPLHFVFAANRCQGEKICLDDAHSQFFHAFYQAVQYVSTLHGSDAGGSSGEDEVARSQCK
jgi:hypothetical protein